MIEEQTTVPRLERVETLRANLGSATSQTMIALNLVVMSLIGHMSITHTRSFFVDLGLTVLGMGAVFFVIVLYIRKTRWWETSPEGLTKRGRHECVIPWDELENFEIEKVDYNNRAQRKYTGKLIITSGKKDWEIRFSHQGKNVEILAAPVDFAASVTYHLKRHGKLEEDNVPEDLQRLMTPPEKAPAPPEVDWTDSNPLP